MNINQSHKFYTWEMNRLELRFSPIIWRQNIISSPHTDSLTVLYREDDLSFSIFAFTKLKTRHENQGEVMTKESPGVHKARSAKQFSADCKERY